MWNVPCHYLFFFYFFFFNPPKTAEGLMLLGCYTKWSTICCTFFIKISLTLKFDSNDLPRKVTFLWGSLNKPLIFYISEKKCIPGG